MNEKRDLEDVPRKRGTAQSDPPAILDDDVILQGSGDFIRTLERLEKTK